MASRKLYKARNEKTKSSPSPPSLTLHPLIPNPYETQNNGDDKKEEKKKKGEKKREQNSTGIKLSPAIVQQ